MSQPVGSGKTYAVIQEIGGHPNANYIYVAPTQLLVNEVMDRLAKQGVDPERLTEITSVNNDPRRGHRATYKRFLDAVRSDVDGSGTVLVTTTETFRNSLHSLSDHQKKRFTVFLDEGMEAIEEGTVKGRYLDAMADMLREEGGLLLPQQNFKQRLNAIAFEEGKAIGAGDVMLTNSPCRHLARLVCSDLYHCVGRIMPGQIEATGLLRPDLFFGFKRVVILQANFENTTTAIFWRKRKDVRLLPHQPFSDLWDTHKNKGPSMRIWHLLDRADRSSKNLLTRCIHDGAPLGEGEALKDNKERVIERCARIVQDAFEADRYIWSANNDFQNQVSHLEDAYRLPTRSEGLDNFRDVHCVASLAVMNPKPHVVKMLSDFSKVSSDEIFFAMKFAHTYQTVGRTSIRDRNSSETLKLVVLSYQEAKSLHELFVGSELVGKLGDIPNMGAVAKANGKASRKRFRYTNADTKAYCVYCKNERDKGRMPLEKDAWMQGVRIPRLDRMHRA